MRVLLFGTYDVRAHPRVGILAKGLQRNGFEVRQVNAPLGVGTAGRVAVLKQPWRLPGFALRLLGRWVSLTARALRLRGSAAPEVVLVGYLGHFDVLLARRLFPRARIVLDHLIGASDTAADRGESGGLKHRLLRALDEAALAAADVVVVDTEEHLAVLPEAHRPKGVVVPVGAPEEWFVELAPGRREGPLRVVFFGLFTPLQGAPVVAEALAGFGPGEIEATMVGSGQELEAAKAAAQGAGHVRWVDWVEPDELPALVASHDVCLGIFGTGPKALRVVPNKVFQGAAAGCAVVTSATPPQVRLLDGAALFVPPGDARALAGALDSLLRNEDVAGLQRSARALAEREFRAEQVVAPLARVLGERHGDAAVEAGRMSL